MLKVIAHPTLLRLLHALSSGEECVCHLTALLQHRQAFVSQQLMFLRQAGLLSDRKEGSRVYYRIKDQSLFRILAAMSITKPGLKPSRRRRIVGCPCPRCAIQKNAPSGRKKTGERHEYGTRLRETNDG